MASNTSFLSFSIAAPKTSLKLFPDSYHSASDRTFFFEWLSITSTRRSPSNTRRTLLASCVGFFVASSITFVSIPDFVTLASTEYLNFDVCTPSSRAVRASAYFSSCASVSACSINFGCNPARASLETTWSTAAILFFGRPRPRFAGWSPWPVVPPTGGRSVPPLAGGTAASPNASPPRSRGRWNSPGYS